MKKFATLLLVALAVCLLAPAAYAQGAEAAKPATNWVAISASFGMALAAAVCGIAQSRVASAACEGMARNPGASDSIRLAMILGLVFIETLVLFTLAIIYLKAV
ncbi:MAG: ATP synthase F0 subunit C [Acidobacteria bacterium]|nr:ATP synthase F0 subunit C [Acidobacteriota bacterium]MBI3662476.1 ATP synthase F0 subunit C [Acidobacteriota bacterium]